MSVTLTNDPKAAVQISVSGPMMDAASIDTGIEKVYEQALDLMGLVTEARVKEQLRKGKGVVTGHLRRSIGGELKDSLTFQVDAGETRQGKNVVYAQWVERGHGKGDSKYSEEATYFKPTAEIPVNPNPFQGYGMFANARKQLEKEDPDKYYSTAVKRHLNASSGRRMV